MINLNLQEYSLIRRNPCHYCGDVIIENTGGAIDRIDNNKGYEIDNCVSCCKLCNRAKHTLTIDQFLSHMQKIVNFNSGEFNNDT